jgi:GntR family transcriptional regulator, transcriptional repressor for pyruvate dehydrogenase complex
MASAGPVASPAPIGHRIRAPKTAELVAGDLRRRIVRGELSEGDVLPPESVLMAQFHVSRPTLREAFRVLESESLITVRRGAHGGARVRPPREDVAARYAGLILQYRGTSVADVLEVRTIVEPQAVGLLARRRTKADLRRLRDHLAEPGPLAESDTDVLRRLERFHGLLVELAGNQTLRVLMGMIEHIVEQVDLTRVRSDEGSAALATAVRRSGRAHAKVVDLIEARDAAAAEQLWRRHLTAGQDYLLRDGATTVLDLLG